VPLPGGAGTGPSTPGTSLDTGPGAIGATLGLVPVCVLALALAGVGVLALAGALVRALRDLVLPAPLARPGLGLARRAPAVPTVLEAVGLVVDAFAPGILTPVPSVARIPLALRA
jgi:hypothetical protein